MANSNLIRWQSIDAAQANWLAAEFESPIYLLDEAGIVCRFEELNQACKARIDQSRIAVSYKTNPTRGILAILHRLGAFAEVISEDEFEIARSLGVPIDKIVINGPVKTDRLLSIGLQHGSRVHCDHADEVERAMQIASRWSTPAKIGIRLYFPGEVDWERFGFAVDETDTCPAWQAVSTISGCPVLNLAGLHVHIGTNVRCLDQFRRMATCLAGFANRVQHRFDIQLEWIDVGGGLAGIAPLVTENRFDPLPLPSIADYCDAILEPLKTGLDSCSANLEIVFEPGRTLFSAFGALLTTVVGRRPPDRFGVEPVILDAGITSLALAHKYNHPVHVCNNREASGWKQLLGPTCMDWDIVSRPLWLPDLRPGDHLVILGTGCYSMALASSFTHLRHGIVGWRAASDWRWLRRPESIQDSISRDVVPEQNTGPGKTTNPGLGIS